MQAATIIIIIIPDADGGAFRKPDCKRRRSAGEKTGEDLHQVAK